MREREERKEGVREGTEREERKKREEGVRKGTEREEKEKGWVVGERREVRGRGRERNLTGNGLGF